jgi:hypothetical protein
MSTNSSSCYYWRVIDLSRGIFPLWGWQVICRANRCVMSQGTATYRWQACAFAKQALHDLKVLEVARYG